MRITKLTAQNFRGFTDLQLDFAEANVTVFIGTNGSGKSSVLDLIAIHLNHFTTQLARLQQNNVLSKSSSGSYMLSVKDIQNASAIMKSLLYLSNKIKDNLNIEIQNFVSVSRNHAKLSKTEHQFMNATNLFLQNFYNEVKKDPQLTIPILIYYQANRTVFGDIYIKEKYKQFLAIPQLRSYNDAFNKRQNDFDDFFIWFKVEEDRENELVRREKNFDLRNPALEVVRMALTQFFSHLSGDKYTNLRIERGDSEIRRGFDKRYPKETDATLLIDKNQEALSMEQLSDGEKNIIVLVADIARRLAIANPTGDALKNGNGIVLIDEIDLHLHPLWQKEVLKTLAKTFPNLQFIVTTHSPYVITHLDLADHQIQVLALTPNQVIPIRAKGKDLSTTSFEVFGVERRPKIYQHLIDDLFKMFETDVLDLVLLEAKFEALKQQLGAADPDVESAKMILEGLKL